MERTPPRLPRRRPNSNRVHLTERHLAQALGVPKDLIRKLKKWGPAHEPTADSDAMRLGGWSGMELAAFCALGHMLTRRQVGRRRSALFYEECMVALANDQHYPAFLAVTEANDRVECAVFQSVNGRVGIPAEAAPFTWVYNLSDLKRLMRAALEQEPLVLPSLGDVQLVQATA